jgi:hypothetical protein
VDGSPSFVTFNLNKDVSTASHLKAFGDESALRPDAAFAETKVAACRIGAFSQYHVRPSGPDSSLDRLER